MKLRPCTVSSDSDNAARLDPGRLPSGMRSFLGHVHIYGSALLKQNTDLTYCSNRSARSLKQWQFFVSYTYSRGGDQTSDTPELRTPVYAPQVAEMSACSMPG